MYLRNARDIYVLCFVREWNNFIYLYEIGLQ